MDPAAPFGLPDGAWSDPLRRGLLALARPALERALALPALNRVYAGIAAGGDGRGFADRALEALGIRYEVPDGDLRSVPAHGPLIVVANHPRGGADGLVLLSLLRRVRPDVRILGNFLLERIPELRPDLFPVDPFGGDGAGARSRAGLRAAIRWVRGGGALIVFPAGEVSRLSLREGRVADPPWDRTAGRLALQCRVPVLPIFLAGRNGPLFQIAGLLHPRLRTALLPRALLDLRGRTVQARTGGPIRPERLRSLPDAEAVTSYLRARTHLLAARCEAAGAGGTGHGAAATEGAGTPAAASPLADPVPPATLEAAIATLPAEQRLAASGPFDVLIFEGDALPPVLREIARLRELTFRQVGEGTGRALDRDRFDDLYLHLFVWNRERREIAGAYRMGRTDVLLPRFGERGLYTATLFRFRGRLLSQIDPALELGRSFVRPDCQKSHSPLTLLWRGIGEYVVRHPRYRRLFGPVSISSEYRSLSRQILMAFLEVTCALGDLGRLVRPRHPARLAPPRAADARYLGTVVRDLDEVDDLIRDVESDRKGMPVLLRQYLRLNARLLGFNVDPDFSDVLDGLLLIDLTRVAHPILQRFMGREGAASFLASHGVAA
ncbi:MAG: lysophospholipid acyltransferase family protein [Candidatus Polarisedimenticolia bacterium]